MELEDLYKNSIKMIKDKFNINEYSKKDFLNIYKSYYKENQPPTNELNKEILKKITQIFIQEKTTEDNIETRVKELENLRNNIDKLSNIHIPITSNNNNQNSKDDIIIPQIQIKNENKNINFKTFIINTNKNNFKITPTIDIKLHMIYPCCLCLPSIIKNQTPYIILSINDGIKNNNYTYIPIINNKWDIWKPITDNYNEINLNNNKWNINIYDFLNNLINFDDFYSTIYNVIYDKNNDNYSLKIDKIYLYNKFDKIKIICNNGSIYDNNIIDIKNENIIISTNNLKYDDFIDAKIYNYNNQFSLLFKYIIK